MVMGCHISCSTFHIPYFHIFIFDICYISGGNVLQLYHGDGCKQRSSHCHCAQLSSQVWCQLLSWWPKPIHTKSKLKEGKSTIFSEIWGSTICTTYLWTILPVFPNKNHRQDTRNPRHANMGKYSEYNNFFLVGVAPTCKGGDNQRMQIVHSRSILSSTLSPLLYGPSLHCLFYISLKLLAIYCWVGLEYV